MARTKRWSKRGKSRVQQAPRGHIEDRCLGTYVVLDLTDLTVTGHYPWCAFSGVEPQPYGGARGIERAAVEPVQRDTV
jgi:hypothetical protein